MSLPEVALVSTADAGRVDEHGQHGVQTWDCEDRLGRYHYTNFQVREAS